MLAHLVSGRWGASPEQWHPQTGPAKRSWFSRLIAALFGKRG